MATLFRFILFSLFVGGWALAGLSLHVIRTPDWISLVPKNKLSIEDTWVDTREWTLDDVVNHPLVVTRLIHVGRADVLQHVMAKDSPHTPREQLILAIERAPEPRHEPQQISFSQLREWLE